MTIITPLQYRICADYAEGVVIERHPTIENTWCVRKGKCLMSRTGAFRAAESANHEAFAFLSPQGAAEAFTARHAPNDVVV
jgi:hypothetical protein